VKKVAIEDLQKRHFSNYNSSLVKFVGYIHDIDSSGYHCKVENDEKSNDFVDMDLLSVSSLDTLSQWSYESIYKKKKESETSSFISVFACSHFKVNLNQICEFIGFIQPSENDKNVVYCLYIKPLSSVLQYNSSDNPQKILFKTKEVFTKLFNGDETAAYLFLFYLQSRIRCWDDHYMPGKFTLNFYETTEAEFFAEIVENLSELCRTMQLNLDSLNTSMDFLPSKYVSKDDKMNSSLLQNPQNTRIVIDETKMQPGQLNETGTANILALKKLAASQQLDINFSIYSKSFNVSYPILILSKSKSLLDCDLSYKIPEKIVKSTLSELSPLDVDELRAILNSNLPDMDFSDDLKEVLFFRLLNFSAYS
ncbi:MAG: hypothetical protein MHPSP_001201, partial [Paramarteilia canceri]